MKNLPINWLLILVLLTSSCVTSRTLRNEKSMEDFLSKATLPVTVQFQTNEFRCKPTLHCYTLIDAAGRVHYAQNVRHRLPRIIPEDSTQLRRNWLERLVGRP